MSSDRSQSYPPNTEGVPEGSSSQSISPAAFASRSAEALHRSSSSPPLRLLQEPAASLDVPRADQLQYPGLTPVVRGGYVPSDCRPSTSSARPYPGVHPWPTIREPYGRARRFHGGPARRDRSLSASRRWLIRINTIQQPQPGANPVTLASPSSNSRSDAQTQSCRSRHWQLEQQPGLERDRQDDEVVQRRLMQGFRVLWSRSR